MSSAPARARAASAKPALRLAVDHAEALRRIADDHIVGDGQIGDQRQFLKDANDAGFVGGGGVREPDITAVEQHAAFIGLHDARHDLDQGRFAGAILAKDRMNAAAINVECRPSRAP